MTQGLATAASSIDENHQLVSRLIYLSSLASDRAAVDPMLDDLRIITSRWRSSQTISKADHQTLQQLETKLKNYLVHDDPLRAFTPQTLDQRLQEQEAQQDKKGMDKNVVALIITLLLSAAAAGAGSAMPMSDESGNSTRLLLATPFLFFTMCIGTIWFYLTALRNFNRQFRRAFVDICTGILLNGVLFSQFVIIQLFGLGDHPLFSYAGITWIVTASFFFVYLGLRRYASLLRIRSRLHSLPLIFLALAAAWLPAFLIIGPNPPAHRLFYSIFLVGLIGTVVFAALGAKLAKQITRSVTAAYARPMRWLYVYLVLVTVSATVAAVVMFWLGELRGQMLSYIIGICGVLPETALLYTGYLFKKYTND